MADPRGEIAVLALVIAFARPTLRSGFLFAGSAAKNVIICLDASYSMGANQETGTAFDAAKKLSKDIVDEALRVAERADGAGPGGQTGKAVRCPPLVEGE